MKHYLHSCISLLAICILTIFVYPANAQENNQTIDLDKKLHYEIYGIRAEYAYYRNKYDDGSYFPAEREQELLNYIENEYFKNKNYPLLQHEKNVLDYASSVAFAKLFLHYAGNPWDISYSSGPPLFTIVAQESFVRGDIPDLTHQQIIEAITPDRNPWGWDLPSNNAIALTKLYVSLGADIHAFYTWRQEFIIIKQTLVMTSLYTQSTHEGRPFIYKESVYNDKHRADDVIKPDADDIGQVTTYYRSPVTYWIEKFIEAGYPASMLDTHRLHYPRFMKDASVAEVTAMLQNPDTHKISANINCPYKDTCPLTPSINMRDAMGRTPLHIAAEQGNQAVFDVLIQIGADESIKDYRGNLPKI